ncbi:hypothetical protein [Acidipropionibacterium jensenii]|uniref:hypothetical protein n=1 Tax=Acidipropionibacterium jensenii TaxID=1749 RepID=UPI00214C80EE|nr:hypothetical protein [Acidipropionibacterium jensenii]
MTAPVVTVTGQHPAILDPVHTVTCTADYDPVPAIVETLVDPLLVPTSPGVPATITIDGSAVDRAGLTDLILSTQDAHVRADAEAVVRQVFGQTLRYYDRTTPLNATEVFVAQATVAHRLPWPGLRVVYNARDDVIPAAKALLADAEPPDLLLAGLAHTYHPSTLGFWFTDQKAFGDFTTWCTAQVAVLGPAVPRSTDQKMQAFTRLSLKGLTESLILRNDDADANEEFSFPRLLVHLLMSWIMAQRKGQSPTTAGPLAFNVGELFCPRTLVLVNVEAHAHATTGAIDAEWALINQALTNRPRVIGTSQLTQLTALPRAAARAAARAADPATQKDLRSATITFRTGRPHARDITADLKRVVRSMGTVTRSQNELRRATVSFVRANRRRPDDFNTPGRLTTPAYKPDIHVFIDTSGSISQENYQDAVKMLIATARKLDVNLYMSSFSHLLSAPTLLRIHGRSMSQIWRQFAGIPKVSGGTDYQQVWEFINAAPARRRRLSVIITDFEYFPPTVRVDHPRNLYYAPCGAMDWNNLVANARNFTNSMAHIEPAIHQRLLGMFV